MISYASCLALLAGIMIIGDSVGSLLLRDGWGRSLPLRLALGYGLGTGTLGLGLFFLGLCGAPLNALTLLGLFVPFLIAFVYRHYTRTGQPRSPGSAQPAAAPPKTARQKKLPPRGTKPGWQGRLASWALLAVIAASAVLITLRAVMLPTHLSDDRAQWGMKAKMLYHEQTVYLEGLFDPDRLQLHTGYPFLTPLVQASFCIAMGRMDDEQSKLPFALYFVGLLLFAYAAQRRHAGHLHALFFTAMLAVLPSFVQDVLGNPSSAYADVPLAFYYGIAVWSLLEWLQDRDRNAALTAGLFSACALYTKQEGLYLWAFLALGGLAFWAADRPRRSRAQLWPFLVLCIALPLALFVPWLAFKSTFVLDPLEQDWSLSQLAPSYIAANLHRVPAVLKALGANFFTPGSWNLLLLVFVACIALYPRQSLRQPYALIVILLACNICAIIAAVVLYPWPWWRNFTGDMHRLLLINIPMITLFVSRAAARILETGAAGSQK